MRRLVLVGLSLWLAAMATAGGGPLIAAHRGGAALWPENSLRAFRGALALGADFVELDVHLTRDGQVVVLHDPSLERTTTGRGEVRKRTLDEIRMLRLKDRDGRETDEPVPTLAELLDLVAPTGTGLLLEVKNAPGRGRYEGIEAAVLELLRVRSLVGRTVVMSFDPEIVRRVRNLDGTVRTSLLLSQRAMERQDGTIEALLRVAQGLGATDVGVQHTMLSATAVAAARARGLRVAAWTVNDEVGMRGMIDAGVDILITDRPDLAKDVLGR